MKKILILLSFCLLCFLACRKDSVTDPFNALSFSSIKKLDTDNKLNQDVILIYNVNTKEQGINAGSVLVYKTDNGLYGKLKLTSSPPQNNLIISFTTYSSNGEVLVSKSNFILQGSYVYDLDQGLECTLANYTQIGDLWVSVDNGIIVIKPQLTAKFYVYFQ